jgi:hypothetical protein
MENTERLMRVQTELMRLSIDLKGTIDCKSTQVLAYADNTAIISRSLSDTTPIHNELAIAAKEMGSGINTNKTKLTFGVEGQLSRSIA